MVAITRARIGQHGLDIVEFLARAWGVRTDDAGLTVWAVLAAPAGRRPADGGAEVPVHT